MSRLRGRRFVACAALATLGLSSSARAVVLSEDPLAGDSATAGASVRLYQLVLRGGPLGAPSAPASFDPAAVSLTVLRPELELKRGSGLSLVLHDELGSTVSSVPTALLGGALSLGQGVEAPLFFPLEWSLERDGYALRNRIAWLYARDSLGDMTLSLGRQPITLGRGQVFTAEDLIAPFSPLQLDTEFKPGADAARIDWTPSESVSVMVVGALAKGGDSAVLSRAELTVDPVRLGVLAGNVRTDWVFGVDLFADLGHGTDLHGEGTATFVSEEARRPSGRSAFERVVVGTTTELAPKINLTAEAYFNGAGARRASDYFAELRSARVAIGETYTLGRLYAGLAAEWTPDPLVHLDLAALANLTDPSLIAAPTVRYGVAENVLLIAGAYLPLGRAPNHASSTAQSEFGLYPELYHLDAKLWF